MTKWERYENQYNDLMKAVTDKANERGDVKLLDKNWGRNNKIQGKSGFRHQIDVHFEYTYDGTHYLQLIECKYTGIYDNKVRFGDVLTFHSRIRDIRKAKKENGIQVIANIVSPYGVTPNGRKYCDYYKIVVNTQQLDKRQGSITTPWEVIIFLGTPGM